MKYSEVLHMIKKSDLETSKIILSELYIEYRNRDLVIEVSKEVDKKVLREMKNNRGDFKMNTIEIEKELLFKEIKDIEDLKFVLSIKRLVKNFKKYKKRNV